MRIRLYKKATMKRLFFFLVFASMTLATSAQNSGTVINDPNAELRSVAGFHAIMVEDGIDLYLIQGKEESVAVSANKDEYRAKIVTSVVDGVLKIYFNQNGVVISWRDRKLRAYVSCKELDAIRAYGGSDVIIRGTLQVKDLQIQASGGSDLVGGVDISGELNVEANGGSDVKLNGKANNMRVKVYGGSDFWGYELVADYAILEAHGGSDVNVSVEKEMSAEARGGSDIYYKGNPMIKYSAATGGGSVNRKS
jgi:Putative auto-transporter adhesin, head GIN domain